MFMPYFENIKQMHLSFPTNHVPRRLHIITAGPFLWEGKLCTRETTEGVGGDDRERSFRGRGGSNPATLTFRRWLRAEGGTMYLVPAP